MKDIKCPLCGTNSEYFLCEIGTNPYYATTAKLFGCPTCKIGFNHPDGWEEYVSKFPPIMRVKVGDKVEVLETGNKSLISEVRQVRVKQGVIAVIGSRRLYNTIDVFRWPWELEQKGGAEQ